MTRVTPERLDAVRGLVEATTPGEWEWNHRYELHNRHEAIVMATLNSNNYPVLQVSEADAAFIAAAPAAVRALLDEIAALQAERDAAESALKELYEWKTDENKEGGMDGAIMALAVASRVLLKRGLVPHYYFFQTGSSDE